MHIAKYSLIQCGHVCAHFERSVQVGHYSNKDIDPERTPLNYNLAPDRGNQVDYIKSKLNTINHVNRKDLVCMCGLILTAPDTLPERYHDIFFKSAYDFFVKNFGEKSGMGEDCIISAYVHKDETSNHLHLAFLPVLEEDGEQRFCAFKVVDKDFLTTLHQRVHDFILDDTGIDADILNGNTKRDSNGKAYSVKQLKYMEYKHKHEYKY